MRFTTTVRSSGGTTTGIPVPTEVVEALAAGKKPPVTVSICGYRYRSSIASRGGEYLISLSGEHRAGAGVKSGDEIEVDVELDAEPRAVSVPTDLAEALDAAPAAALAFRSLSYSRQLQHVLSVEGAKTEETRRRRVEKVLASLVG
jgi:Bacteriocin-protection, YdeI or OmpD-Associated/Domain of unknown function (DUF1905)